MLAAKRFCVKCGKETEGLISGLCPDCFLGTHAVLEIPAFIQVDYDRRSGRLRAGREWVPDTDEEIAKIVASKVVSLAAPKRLPVENLSVDVDRDERGASIGVSFSTMVEGVPLEVHANTEVRFRNTISDASMKLSSYYHEAIIQVRFGKKPGLGEGRAKLQELLRLLAEEKKKIELSEAIDTKNVRGGFDVLVGSAKAAKKVALRMGKKYGFRPIYSNKMIGMNDNGTTKYRHTYCLKFP